jgi:putative transposase
VIYKTGKPLPADFGWLSATARAFQKLRDKFHTWLTQPSLQLVRTYQRDRKRECPATQDRQDAWAFPTDDAATRPRWLALRNITADWSRGAYNWKAAMNQFEILFEDRFTRTHL